MDSALVLPHLLSWTFDTRNREHTNSGSISRLALHDEIDAPCLPRQITTTMNIYLTSKHLDIILGSLNVEDL